MKSLDFRTLVFALMMMLELISLRTTRKRSSSSSSSSPSLTRSRSSNLDHLANLSEEFEWKVTSRLVVEASQLPTIYQTDCPIKLFSRDTADNQEERPADNDSSSAAAAGENTGAKQLDSRRRRRRNAKLYQLLSENQSTTNQQPNYISEIGVPEPNTGQSTSYYQCPGTDYPSDHQLCCADVNECCPLPNRAVSLLNFYNFDNRQFTIATVLAVSLICFLAIATLSICCFWSICPLYNSCRIRYYRDDAGCADKMGEFAGVNVAVMPGEDSPIANTLVIAKPYQPELIESENFINEINAQNRPNPTLDGAREVAV